MTAVFDIFTTIGGFFYTIFSALGAIAQVNIFDFLNNGYFGIFNNPISDYSLVVSMTPQNTILGQLLNKVLSFVNLPSNCTVLMFMLLSVVLCFAVVILVRWVKLFTQ